MQPPRTVLWLRVSDWPWAVAGVATVAAIATVLWAIISKREDVVAIVGDALTLLTLVAALVALGYAATSAQAARDTVKPLEDMASDLATTAGTIKANLELAERGRLEDRLTQLLARYQRVYEAVMAMQRMVDTHLASHVEIRNGQVILRAALAPFTPDELPKCHGLADAPLGESAVPQGGVQAARLELERVLDDTRSKLDHLLASVPKAAGDVPSSLP